jgi:purine-binding chemotaxis protein CheW
MPRAPTDWTATRGRLERAAALLNGSRSGSEIAEVLRKRARALAVPLEAPNDDRTSERVEIVAFTLAGQAYGITGDGVREAIVLSQLTPLPGMPATLRGLANVRSRIVPAFDLKPLLQVPAGDERRLRDTMLIVISDGMEFGLLVDDVLGPRTISISRLRTDVPGLQSQYLRGFMEDGLMLLDLAAIANALTIDGRVA